MDAWQRTWLYSSKISWTYVANGAYNTISGWDSLSSFANNIMKNNPEKSLVDIKNDSFNITSNGNIAWVEYKQRITTVGDTSNLASRSQSYRALVKDNNEWKIISMIVHHPESFTSNTPESIENSLNTTGYNLMAANRLNDAIEVFRLNVKLNPKGWNTYDSLGEALALAENKKEAIENYEKSVKLNPKNENGIKALQKLRAK
jgi:tetratricopeptide (TPR) repeat protein